MSNITPTPVDLDDELTSTKPTLEVGSKVGDRQLTDVKVTDGRHEISYSKYNTLYQCPRKFYAEYIDETPETVKDNGDTHRAYIGIITQYIFERITNDRLYKTYTYDEFCAVIDEDLKKLKPLILELDKQTEYINTRDEFATGGLIIDKAPKCLVETSERYKIFIAQNSIIKKIREHYKAPLKWYLTQNLDNFTCELQIKTELNNRIFKGTIDFIEVTDTHIRIIDGKKKKTVDKSTGESLHNKTQLLMYKLLAESHFKKPVTEMAYLYYETNEYEKVDLTDQDEQDFIKTATEAFDLIETYTDVDQYKPNPSYINCLFCPLVDTCKSYTTKS